MNPIPSPRAGGPAAAACALAAALTVMPPTDAAAQQIIEDLRPVRFFAGFGLTAGGDRLATARYRYYRDESVHAGGLLQLHAGIEFRMAPGVTGALSAGYHADGTSGWRGSYSFDRWPIEALAHVAVAPRWRVGGGARLVLNPRLRSDGDFPDVNERFKNALGGVVEVEYRFTDLIGLKLRGVAERYKSKQALPSADGNHVGLVMNFYF
ncbi:MAG: hypothetical protein AB7G13_13515 [Lautropia sp.]